MSKSIVITVPHALGKDEARRRIAFEIEQLKNVYVGKLAHSEVKWMGDAANIRVVALAQEIRAQIDVAADTVRLEIILPWLFSSLAGRLQSLLATSARDRLALPRPSDKR